MNKLIPVLGVCAAVSLGVTASAYAGIPKSSNPEIVELTYVCGNDPSYQTFTYSLATFEGKDQKPMMSDGKTTLEIHAVGSRFGKFGKWITVTGTYNGQKLVTNGTENTLRFYFAGATEQGLDWDLVRLRHDDWGSNIFPSGQVNC